MIALLVRFPSCRVFQEGVSLGSRKKQKLAVLGAVLGADSEEVGSAGNPATRCVSSVPVQ